MYRIIAEQKNQIVWRRKRNNRIFQNSGEKCSFKFNAEKKSPFHLAFSRYSHKENSDSRSKIHMFE